VSAAVSVTVKSNVTTTTQSVFGAISGASSTNTITIDGGSFVLSYGGSYEAISFTGADYVTIKNATIRNTTTGAYAAILRLTSGSDYNKQLLVWVTLLHILQWVMIMTSRPTKFRITIMAQFGTTIPMVINL